MKQLNAVLKVAVATLLLFAATSFKPAPNHSNTQKVQYYYWYVDGGTVYDGWYSVAQETARLEDELDLYVDEDPINGTLVASGYAIKGLPHEIYASVFLYSHE